MLHIATQKNHTQSLYSYLGFTLIENLITLVIISIGLIGLVKLQNMSYKVNTSASMESNAISLVRDMAERIRSNPKAFNTYISNVGFKNSSCHSVLGCSEINMANHDIWEWQQQTNNTLPLSRLEICKTTQTAFSAHTGNNSPLDMCQTNGDRALVFIQWDHNGDGVLDDPPVFSLTGDLFFYTTVMP